MVGCKAIEDFFDDNSAKEVLWLVAKQFLEKPLKKKEKK